MNLASRLTAYAKPSSALATGEARKTACADYRWSFAGKRKFKAIKGEVKLYRVRPASPSG